MTNEQIERKFWDKAGEYMPDGKTISIITVSDAYELTKQMVKQAQQETADRILEAVRVKKFGTTVDEGNPRRVGVQVGFDKAISTIEDFKKTL